MSWSDFIKENELRNLTKKQLIARGTKAYKKRIINGTDKSFLVWAVLKIEKEQTNE